MDEAEVEETIPAASCETSLSETILSKWRDREPSSITIAARSSDQRVLNHSCAVGVQWVVISM